MPTAQTEYRQAKKARQRAEDRVREARQRLLSFRAGDTPLTEREYAQGGAAAGSVQVRRVPTEEHRERIEAVREAEEARTVAQDAEREAARIATNDLRLKLTERYQRELDRVRRAVERLEDAVDAAREVQSRYMREAPDRTFAARQNIGPPLPPLAELRRWKSNG